MTKQLTKQEVEEIMISFLPQKWHKVGEPKPIYIGDVLDYAIRKPGGLSKILKEEIINTWFNLGLRRSLQEICEASGWEYTLTARDEDSSIRRVEVLTSPEANALFSFLQEIV